MINPLKLQEAIRHAEVETPVFLGEGAWHHAWKVRKDGSDWVLRIPKEIAYGQPVPFDEAALKAEYGGTQLYYAAINQAVKGAAPMHYSFYVTEELTYTRESFVGTAIDLAELKHEAAFQVGQNIGEIYRKTEKIPHGLSGYGFLAWSKEDGLRGSIAGDAQQGLKEESEEQLADFETLCRALPEFRSEAVEKAIHLAAELRQQRFTIPLLTNQDASPENILMNGTQVCLIDPYPILYYPRGMAGNFMNLYETYFVSLAATERYRKHRFDVHEAKMKAIAEGFLAGYSDGIPEIVREVRGEQVLQVLESAFSHLQLLEGELRKEAEIRFGTKEDIAGRLQLFLKELKRLAAINQQI
ncbi:hypothetical protein [Planococcus ruber]|uniref:hypothetical protein n=1 Tax=Planococcus ruber TaxID=2027871 RepID=UPI001FF0344E|nr:hypothetical protein [Planococcus ruber]MCJ1909199.1 hypothetical protein [Planococcus ruber]